ncbi:hypothetical protein [Sulfolobus tengchongensis spindle-shaped virus 4]|nr:hypothetical protein [Sulfolobus tengchongensis spindle-shaped virus 4]
MYSYALVSNCKAVILYHLLYLTCSPPWKGRGFPSRVDHRSHH